MFFNLATSPVEGMYANSTQALPGSLGQIPANVLEAFIPGYSLISGFILEWLGFDISIIVSIFALLLGVVTAVRYLYKALRTLGLDYLTASITVYAGDDIYDHVLGWVSEQAVTMKSRELVVKSGWVCMWDDEDGEAERSFEANCEPGSLVNFRHWEDKLPPRFEPYEASGWFLHKGHWFRLEKEKDTVLNSRLGQGLLTETERLTILVMGRSTKPIKDLIIEARDQHLSKGKGRTVVRRPSPKEARQRGRYLWTKVANRPSRSIETVVLDEEQKDKILMDINEYLHPATSHWYANRGIPYRRGYLFHGPPGTGKTSLSFALAGVFGLDIYCVSLLEPSLTEEDLGMLFNNLPRRCVVLLEDIDSAGLGRKAGDEGSELLSGENDDKNPKSGSSNASKRAAKKKQWKKKARGDSDAEPSTGISLSGLLNAIDGVASHEGRVLVMTTNHPEQLDPALIRPGRVDMQIEFTLATRTQIREIFVRMYSPDKPILSSRSAGPSSRANRFDTARDAVLKSPPPSRANAKHPILERTLVLSPPPSPIRSDVSVSSNCVCADHRTCSCPTKLGDVTDTQDDRKDPDLSALAFTFAEGLPEFVFSPAEIQGFLLTRKGDPLRAVNEVTKWRDQELAAKKRAKNTKKSDSASE
jgi:chaperone BCS1